MNRDTRLLREARDNNQKLFSYWCENCKEMTYEPFTAVVPVKATCPICHKSEFYKLAAILDKID